jgi:hypothetical protein
MKWAGLRLFEKYYIQIKISGVKIYEEKQLLLCSVELYSHFKNSHPGVKVGFLMYATFLTTESQNSGARSDGRYNTTRSCHMMP